MADKKITQLDTLASPTDTDLFLIVDDVSGTPTSKKLTALALSTYVEGNIVFPAGVEELDDLADVTAPSPSTGDILSYSGSEWVNSAPVAAFNPVEAAVFL